MKQIIYLTNLLLLYQTTTWLPVFSIILCVAANGICGLKPPIGQLSQKGIIPIASSFDSAEPLW